MRMLLDTHTLFWMLEGDARMSPTAKAAVEANDAERLLSLASLWEASIKSSLGKLRTRTPVGPTLLADLRRHAVQLLPISAEHALGVIRLPLHHRDPFDRLLASQCLSENLPIVSADPALDAYGVTRIW